MNLAFITRRHGRIGGTERDLYELIRRLAARGHQVHVYCCEVHERPLAGVEIHRVPILGFGRLARFLSLALLGPRMARRSGHDLVISYERVLNQDIARCGGGTHRLFLQRMAGNLSPARRFLRSIDIYHQMVQFVEKRQFSSGHFRRAHAVSKLVKREIMDAYGVRETDIDVVYGGVDTELFHPDNVSRFRSPIRRDLSIPEDARVVLFLGNGFKRKGLDTLLHALANASSTDLFGLVVGTDARLSAYRDLVTRLGISDRVRFAGQQSATHEYYAAADIFVLPSIQEAFGNVVLEAMATGLPVIASSCAGAAEVLPESAKPFLLADPLDADAMAEAIERALAPNISTALARFGHWAALQGHCPAANTQALDTGCVYGGRLTALRLEDSKFFQVKCKSYQE